jgi:transcriptional repressor NrdR
MQVIKKDERREEFDREKIKSGIIKSAQRTDLEESRINEVAEKVTVKVEGELGDREEVRSSEIKEIVLRELDVEERKIADQFRSYQKQSPETTESEI